jgi:malonate-semialdehyde dehydrogenase (acetylating)/methylmalonate-semialdehyde dehydrogenase
MMPVQLTAPLSRAKAKARILDLIRQGKEEGANCEFDGSQITVPEYPEGNWIGPTLFTGVKPEHGDLPRRNFWPGTAHHRSRHA